MISDGLSSCFSGFNLYVNRSKITGTDCFSASTSLTSLLSQGISLNRSNSLRCWKGNGLQTSPCLSNILYSFLMFLCFKAGLWSHPCPPSNGSRRDPVCRQDQPLSSPFEKPRMWQMMTNWSSIDWVDASEFRRMGSDLPFYWDRTFFLFSQGTFCLLELHWGSSPSNPAFSLWPASP